jgi:hypothetical protein
MVNGVAVNPTPMDQLIHGWQELRHARSISSELTVL